MGSLELREEPGGLRYYLDGRPIHAGTCLELQLFANDIVDHLHARHVAESWILGRYEWSCRRGTRPLFYVGLADGNVVAHFELPERAILRWPKES